MSYNMTPLKEEIKFYKKSTFIFHEHNTNSLIVPLNLKLYKNKLVILVAIVNTFKMIYNMTLEEIIKSTKWHTT
jgi:hypothetical protein